MKVLGISAQLQFMVTHAGKSIHVRIKQARLAIGINQSALAAKLGIKPQSVQNWESGISSPKSTRLETLAKVLEVSPVWLLSGEQQQIHQSSNINQEELLLIKQFRRMNKSRQQIFAEIVQTLAENS